MSCMGQSPAICVAHKLQKVPFNKEFFITLTSEPRSLPRASLSLFPFHRGHNLLHFAAPGGRSPTPCWDTFDGEVLTRFLHSLRFPSTLHCCYRPAVLAASLGGGESSRGGTTLGSPAQVTEVRGYILVGSEPLCPMDGQHRPSWTVNELKSPQNGSTFYRSCRA